jgi:glutamate formiminotransferase / 5-formyltetrahydrofolate cyclo-ligase
MLLAVPNVSEGRDAGLIATLEIAFGTGAEVLDRHSDELHNRSVFTLAGEPGTIGGALLAGAITALNAIDVNEHDGLHPFIGALDVCPLVWTREGDRSVATESARSMAISLAALEIPVFLYGELASTEERRERAFFRRGGLAELRERMASGDLQPDFGPPEPHPTAGATLVTARPPLAALNIEIDTGDAAVAREIASSLREAGGGLEGVRAIGLHREAERSQVSTNIHDPLAIPLARVVEAVRELAAAHGATPVSAELVGLVPEAALQGYPADVPIIGFDPNHQTIERRLTQLDFG